MIDSFASNPADGAHEIQLQIDEDLRNAQPLKADHEKAFPKDQGNMLALVQHALHRPRTDALYPKLAAAADPGQWLMALLRRFAWNHARGDAGSEWVPMLVEMVHFALNRVRTVSEEEFVSISEWVEALWTNRYPGILQTMGAYACGLEKAGTLGPAARDGLRRLLQLAVPAECSLDDRDCILWPLFRSGSGLDADGPFWSARVRRDIAAMAPKLSSAWLKALDPESRTCNSGVKSLGNAQLEAGLRGWIAILREVPEPKISPDDAVLFCRLIALCNRLDGQPCDQLLYEIACIPWTRQPEHRWMYPYLQLLRSRPQRRAFACLEALVINPVTATEEVRRLYEGLLAVFGSEATSELSVGVDGFLLDSEPSLAAHQRRIDQLLRMGAAAAERGRYVDPGVAAHLEQIRMLREEDFPPATFAAMKMWESQMTRAVSWFPVAPEVEEARKAMVAAMLEEFAGDPASFSRAVMARNTWIREHKHEYSADALQLWHEWLNGLGCCGGLVSQSLAKVDELSLESLLEAIQAGRNATKVFELCQKYVARNGWHASLVEPFRQMIPKLGVPSNQTENARAEWFLWFENVAPIEVSACWSYRIKQDIRSMPPKEATAWRALLDNPAFLITGTPPAKWRKAAEKLFPAVGAAEFRSRFVRWFDPFAKGEPMRLTITGRNMLRVLIWYVLVAEDPAVDEALVGFANARWKTKEFAKRVAQAEMAFSYVLSKRDPKGAVAILEPLVASGQAFEGSSTHRIYLGLCARQNRTPVPALPQKPGGGNGRSAADNLTPVAISLKDTRTRA